MRLGRSPRPGPLRPSRGCRWGELDRTGDVTRSCRVVNQRHEKAGGFILEIAVELCVFQCRNADHTVDIVLVAQRYNALHFTLVHGSVFEVEPYGIKSTVGPVANEEGKIVAKRGKARTVPRANFLQYLTGAHSGYPEKGVRVQSRFILIMEPLGQLDMAIP